MKEFLQKMLGELSTDMDKEKDFRVAKSIPMSKEQVKEFSVISSEVKKGSEMIDMMRTHIDRIEALRRRFWSTIELQLNEYGEMRVNTNTNEIEIAINEENKKKPVKSPYVI